MKAAERRAPLSEINVTPFVDVMLVLLIIFMVAAPMLEQGIKVALSKAGTSRRLGGGSNINITLTKEHVVYLNDEIVTLEELKQRLADQRSRPVVIRADRNAYVSKLMELWDLCREIGFQEIQIATHTE